MTFGEYLEAGGIGARGRRWRERLAGRYEAWLRERGVRADEAGYAEVMAYVGYAAEVEGRCRDDVRRVLPTLRHYFGWRGLPDATLGERLRGRQRAAAPVLLTAEELDAVWEAYRAAEASDAGRMPFYGESGGLVVGLAAYQGLGRVEVEQLRPDAVDLEGGVVRAPGTRHRLAREVALEGHQVLSWQAYLSEGGGRERAVAGARAYEAGEAEARESWLIPSADRTGEVAGRLSNQFAWLGRRVREAAGSVGLATAGLQHLRQSRIGVWVERYGLRRAQHLSGLASVSSVERYRRSDLDDLARELGEHHPLGEYRPPEEHDRLG